FQVLETLSGMVRPGATTRELEVVAQRIIAEAGGTPLFLGVVNSQARFPFPAAICASVNEEVVHGIPDDRPLRVGDIVKVDVGVRLKGYCGDSARTYAVGSPPQTTRKLLEVTRQALDLAVQEMRPYIRWNRIARQMQKLVEDNGFGVVREFVG